MIAQQLQLVVRAQIWTILLVGLAIASYPSEVPSADFLAAALENQEALCGPSIDIHFVQNTLGVAKPNMGRFSVHYVRTPDLMFMDEKVDNLTPSNDWVTAETAIHRYNRLTKEYRILGTNLLDREHTRTGYVATKTLSQRIAYATVVDPALYSIAGIPLKQRIRDGSVCKLQETVDGHACWRIDMPVPQVKSPSVSASAWLDPEIGFCPRKVELREVRKDSSRSVIITYMKYQSPREGLWLPVQATVVDEPRTSPGTTIDVLDVNVGKDIPADQLQIEFPSGTKVLEYSDLAWITAP